MTGELVQAGITISESTKKSKDFVSILDEIETQVKGTNRALAETATGGIDQFGNSWGTVKNNWVKYWRWECLTIFEISRRK